MRPKSQSITLRACQSPTEEKADGVCGFAWCGDWVCRYEEQERGGCRGPVLRPPAPGGSFWSCPANASYGLRDKGAGLPASTGEERRTAAGMRQYAGTGSKRPADKGPAGTDLRGPLGEGPPNCARLTVIRFYGVDVENDGGGTGALPGRLGTREQRGSRAINRKYAHSFILIDFCQASVYHTAILWHSRTSWKK